MTLIQPFVLRPRHCVSTFSFMAKKNNAICKIQTTTMNNSRNNSWEKEQLLFQPGDQPTNHSKVFQATVIAIARSQPTPIVGANVFIGIIKIKLTFWRALNCRRNRPVTCCASHKDDVAVTTVTSMRLCSPGFHEDQLHSSSFVKVEQLSFFRLQLELSYIFKRETES